MKRFMLSSPASRARTITLCIASICFALIAFVLLPTRQHAATNSARAALHYFAPPQPSTSDGVITPAGNTITVNSLADVANSTDGLCTLREAITAANTNTASGATVGECAAGSSSGSDTINFSVTGTINLASALPDITSDITISGPGSSQLTVMRSTAGGTPQFRIFNINSGATVNISGLSISNGHASDGVSGGSRVSSSDGGGILNSGTLTLSNSAVTGNQAGDGVNTLGSVNGGSGGGIFNFGTLTFTNSTASGNRSGNSSSSGGGFAGSGGGISNAGTVTVTNSTISGNQTGIANTGDGIGGGIANSANSGTLTITNSTISGNQTGTGGGSSGGGGGLQISVGTVTVNNTTFSGNAAGASGGAISHQGGITTLTNVTITNNRSDSGNAGGRQGGGIFSNAGTIMLRNTIVANNFRGSGTTRDDVNGAFDMSSSFNLIGDGSGMTGIGGSNNQVGSSGSPINAMLAALANNGGSTQTHLPLPSSPAINAGDPAFVPPPATDQRGLPRVVGGRIDIGAVETNYTITSTAVSSSVNPSALGQSVTFTATVTSTAGTPTGTAQFKDGGANLGAAVALNASGMAQLTTSSLTVGTHTITVDYSGDANFATSTGTLLGGQVVGSIIKFSSATYSVKESDGFVTITVNRSGDTSGAVTVDYATDDTGAPTSCANTTSGLASSRCDYTTALGTLRFAATETQKTFAVLITQDSYTEGPEMFTVRLSNLTGAAVLATPSKATVTINDSASPAPNAIDDAAAFVRMHFHDFLNREPDPDGLDFWTKQITSCGSDQQCIELRRINVSAAFYVSIEFQGTGYLVERLYKVAYGDAIGTSTLGGAHSLAVPIVRFNEFLPDTQRIGLGVVVGQTGWEAALENNKQAFTLDFVQRTRFITAFPTTLTPAQFVNMLFTNAGLPQSDPDYTAAINEFPSATNTADMAARSRALRRVAENSTLNQQEFNRAFVLMQFLGYLRRNPNDPQDTDYTGYDFWLTKLNQFNGNYISAEMVKAFIVSGEYRNRFGP